VNWRLVSDGTYAHLVPDGDVIAHETDPTLQPCVCMPMCQPLYCVHGEHVGWLLRHSVLAPGCGEHDRG